MILRITAFVILYSAVVAASPTHHFKNPSHLTNPTLQRNTNHQDDIAQLQNRLQKLLEKLQGVSSEFVQLSTEFALLGFDLKKTAILNVIGALETGISTFMDIGGGLFKNIEGTFNKVLEFPMQNSGSGLFGINFPEKNPQGFLGIHGKGHVGTESKPGASFGGMFDLNIGHFGKEDHHSPAIDNGAHQGSGHNVNPQFHVNPNFSPNIPNYKPLIPNKQESIPSEHQSQHYPGHQNGFQGPSFNLPALNNGGHQGPNHNANPGLQGNTNFSPKIPNPQPANPSGQQSTHPGHQGQNYPGPQNSFQGSSFNLPALNNGGHQGPDNNANPGLQGNPNFSPDMSNLQPGINPNGQKLTPPGNQGQNVPGPQPNLGDNFQIPNLQDQQGPVDTAYPPFIDPQKAKEAAEGLPDTMMNFNTPGDSLAGTVQAGTGFVKQNLPNFDDSTIPDPVKDRINNWREARPDPPDNLAGPPLDSVSEAARVPPEGTSSNNNDPSYPNMSEIPASSGNFAPGVPQISELQQDQPQQRNSIFNGFGLFG